jgi:uncharacterized coiled-coil protein SlyX
MKKYELLNQLLNEKAEAMKTIEELCAEWNITLSDKEAQVINNIIINKGKVVEVQTTKEVVIDNTDNDRIQELEEKLAFKELLLNEYNDNMDEKIKIMNEQKNKIEDLEIELESKDMFIEGMKLSYEQQIAELKATIKRLNTKIMLLEAEDEVFEEEEEIVADNDGGDAVSLFNIPEEYKDNQEIKSIVEKNTEKYNNAQGFGAGPFQVTAEQEREEIIKQTNKAIQKCIDEMKKTDDYKISLTKLYDKKNQVVTAVKGHITLAGRQYAFKYGATHENPCVYGCMDMNLITEAKKVLDSVSGMIKDTTEQKHAYDVVYAFDKGYVVWQAEDGCYKGYTKDYAFSWDGRQAQPCGATLMNAIENKPFRPMNKSWGNGFVKRANEIMAFCKTIDKYFESTNEEPEETNEIVVNTNDVVLNVAQEVEELDI